MEFQEKYKIDIADFDSTGSTVERISPYYDMQDYRRIDFVLAGRMPMTTASTSKQTFKMRLLQATDATGGGASAISSATCDVSRPAGAASTGSISTGDKVTELMVRFSTNLSDAMGDTFSVMGQQFVSATGNSAAYYFAGGASDAATVASEGFLTAFNNTNNTLSSVWEAVRDATGSPYVFIRPRDQNNTTWITATFTTKIPCGISKALGHIGIDRQHMKDGFRYVAIGIYTTSTTIPRSVVAFREHDMPPVNQKTMILSKSLSASTSK